MNENPKIIEVQSLKKSYKTLHVLKDVNFTVNKGSIFALLGSNGAGKTTTVNLLATLLHPTGGTAVVCGFDTVRQGNKVREHISLTGQYAAVDELLTGRENLRMMGALRHLPHKNKRADELLNSFGLNSAANRKVSAYSGGMRRRLDLAMSLLGNPDVIFLDEPTTGLDPQSRLAMWSIIRSLADSGTTIFLTTQYLEEAEHLADKIAVLHQGKIIAEGSPDKLKGMFSLGTAELIFDDPNEMDKAIALLKEHKITYNKETLTINILTDGSVKQLSELLNLLRSSSILLSGFAQKLPTLEEVFLTLIGENRRENHQ